ncbi:MAG: hypothetical protein AAGJ11_10215 [Bacteroidota bacterium]
MRALSLLVVAAALAGCVSFDQLYREAERQSGRWFPDSRRANVSEIRRDVRDYVRDVDRAVRLDARQAERIERRLEDRTYDLLTRRRDYGASAYPFPRERRASREVRDWWRATDRDIERELGDRQRRDYRRFVDRLDDRRRDRDDDWDDDDWDDDDDR